MLSDRVGDQRARHAWVFALAVVFSALVALLGAERAVALYDDANPATYVYDPVSLLMSQHGATEPAASEADLSLAISAAEPARRDAAARRVSATVVPLRGPSMRFGAIMTAGYDCDRHPGGIGVDAGPLMCAVPESVEASGSQASLLGVGFAAEDVGSGARSLFHYTTEEGQKGILDSGQLNPSLNSVNPSDARYGNGQYLTDIAPGTKTGPQLSRALVGNPFQGARFTHYLEIDVSGLNVIEGRAGVFVVPGEEPLDLFGRILGYGANG